jgi:hypothetical protein
MTENTEQIPQLEVVSETSMEAKIKGWLDNQGTILELAVASKFQAALGRDTYTNSVYHGRHYRDTDPLTLEDKFREIDVVVHATPVFTPTTNLSLWLILECKSRTKHPWIFYRSSERTQTYAKYEDVFMVMSNRAFNSRGILGLRGVSIFNIEGIPFSTGGVAALTRENDELPGDSRNAVRDSRNAVRDSILQVLSATKGISLEVGMDAEGLTASILVPIVVTKTSMFTVTLDEAGAPKIESTLRELVVTRSKLDDGNLKYVWVIHESQIDELVSEFATCLPNIDLNL